MRVTRLLADECNSFRGIPLDGCASIHCAQWRTTAGSSLRASRRSSRGRLRRAGLGSPPAGLELRLRAHEIPNDVTVHAFLRPRGPAAPPPRARTDRRDARHPVSDARPGASRLPARRRGRPRRRDAVDLRQHHDLRGRQPPGSAAARGDADLAAIGSIVRVVRHGPRPRHRAAARARHGARVEPGADGRPLRVHDRLRSIGASRSTPRLAGSACAS